jgi:MoaA/NifB/PqqE/SkfB family radical SAM enzyme
LETQDNIGIDHCGYDDRQADVIDIAYPLFKVVNKYAVIRFCNQPWKQATIQADGSVFTCACAYWHTAKPVGNILDTSMSDIWQGMLINIFRRTIIDQNFQFCKTDRCPEIWNLEQVDQIPHDLDSTVPEIIYLTGLDKSCNLSCPMCRPDFILHRDKNPVVAEILRNLSESYRDHQGKVIVQADGYGEALISPTYLDFWTSTDLPTSMIFNIMSNGTTLSKNLSLLEKIQNNVGLISVSMDAATKHTYKKIRGANLDIVVQGIKDVISLGIKVSANFSLQRSNYQEVIQWRDLCRDIGVTNFYVDSMSRMNHMSDQFWDDNKLGHAHVDLELLCENIRELEKDPAVILTGGIWNHAVQSKIFPIIPDTLKKTS